jgi:ketosteroid isomerase-like protein
MRYTQYISSGGSQWLTWCRRRAITFITDNLFTAGVKHPTTIRAMEREGTMPSNIETAKRAYELFQRGDVPTLIKDIIDDNCQWTSPGPKDKLPWAGSFKGKQEIAAFFSQVAKYIEFSEFVPRDMIERGDTVVTIGTSAGRIKTTGKMVNNHWVHVAKYSPKGTLVFFQDYHDTAADVAAMS